MSRVLAGRFERWFEHEREAHAKVLRSLESVPAERRSGPEFEKAVAILAHVAAARRVWLVRLGILSGRLRCGVARSLYERRNRAPSRRWPSPRRV